MNFLCSAPFSAWYPLCIWTAGLVAISEGQAIRAQTVVAGATPYTFKAWNGGPALVMTSDVSGQTGNNNSADSSAVLTSVNGKPAVPTLDLAGQLGWQSGAFFNTSTGTAFANGTSAVALTFSALADKKQSNSTGSFVVVFDTTEDGVIGSSDSGFALNATFSLQSNTITVTQTSLVAFTLSATNGPLVPTSAFNATNVTALGNYTASINGSTGGSGSAADGNMYTVAMAALLSDISGTWHPVQGTPTLTTAFTASPILGAGSINLIDWYGTSGLSAQTASLNIPEPATGAWAIGLLGPSAYVLRRRRQRASR